MPLTENTKRFILSSCTLCLGVFLSFYTFQPTEPALATESPQKSQSGGVGSETATKSLYGSGDYLLVVTIRSTGIRQLHQLKRRKLSRGQLGSSAETAAVHLLWALNFDCERKDLTCTEDEPEKQPVKLKKREVDAFITVSHGGKEGPMPAQNVALLGRDLVLLPIDNPDVISRLEEKGYIPTQIDLGVYVPEKKGEKVPTVRTIGREDWATQNKNYFGWRYGELNQITPDNVKNLKVAWSFSLGTINGQEGGPLVVGDTMYVHSSYSTSNSHNIFALDLSKEGAPIKWKYAAKHDPRAVPVACCDLVHRGVQYANGKILYQTLDGIVIALDAKTGKELWKTRNADPSKGETNTAAGIVAKDKYIVGVAGDEFGVRGWVAAYDINTGKQVWKARNVGPDEDLLLGPDFNAANPHYGRFGEGTKSWPGEQWKVGGGTTWGYYAYDPELNLLYYGTGNPGTWNPSPRKGGDNKWSTSIWARNADTGQAKWAYQMTPWDNWDYDGINESILTEQTIDGKKRKVLTHFDRNGFVYTLDRTDGTLLRADAFVYVNWAKGIGLKTGRPIVNPEKLTKQGEDTKNICPSAIGAKSEQPAAYSPKTNLFYVSSNNTCMNYGGVLVQYMAGAPYLIFSGHEGKDDWWGEIIAWDAVRGKRVWSIKEPFPVQSGPVVTATNVVFYGTMDGWFKAADARDGKLLWKHKVGSGIIGNPITYKGSDSKQYVSVYSGSGRSFLATVALDLPPDDPTAALGGVKVAYPSGLPMATTKGGTLYVFTLD